MSARVGGRPQGQLERSLIEMTIGVRDGLRERDRALRSTRHGEYDQQVRFETSGVAAAGWGFVDQRVTWEHPFVYSPLQRTLPFVTPQVTGQHVEWTNTLAGLVLAHVHVIGWLQTDQGWYIGATVRVATSAPGATGTVPYSGVVHLTFQGFAYPTDDEGT